MYKPLMNQYSTFTLALKQHKKRIRWRSKTHKTKFPYGETSVRRIFFTANFPYGEISLRRNFLRQNFLMAKNPYGEISLRWNFYTAKFPTAKYPTEKFPTANFPSAVIEYLRVLIDLAVTSFLNEVLDVHFFHFLCHTFSYKGWQNAK